MPDLTRILTVAALAATLHCGGGSSGTPYQPPKPFTAEVTFRSARNMFQNRRLHFQKIIFY